MYPILTTVVSVVKKASTTTSIEKQKRWYEWEYLPLLLCLLIALIVRVWLIIHTGGVLDGDEALTGIQAEHILQGERPTYYYGQPYMGSLEAYLIAGLLAVFGSSVWALRAEPILISLVVVWATWKLAGALGQAAQVQPRDQLYFQAIAGIFAAIAPLYGLVVELRTWGGHVEIYVIMLMLLLAALRLTVRWQAGASLRELAWRWAGIGFLVGLGFWVYPLIISAVVAAALWILGYCVLNIVLWKYYGADSAGQAVIATLKGLLMALAALPAACIGSAPALVWGAANNWANVTFLFGRGGGSSLRSMHILSNLYFGCVAPRIIGGSLPGERFRLVVLHTFPLYLGVACIGATALLMALSFVWPNPLLLQVRRLALLPALFAVSTYFFFLISWGPAWCYDHDLIGRYAVPLMLALPFFIATVFTFLNVSLRNSRAAGEARGAGVTPGYVFTRALPPRFVAITQGVLLAILVMSLSSQVASYVLTNPGLTLQSTFCRDAPAHDEEIIAYMQREHIHYAWSTFWVGNPVIFKTNGSIIIADAGIILNHEPRLGRLPQYPEAVLKADRPSLLTFVKHGETQPALLSVLDSLHVTYRAALFPAETGVDMLLVTPLNRTVSLLEAKAFRDIFLYCPSRWGADIPDV